jgi:hypothetical protein
LCTLHTRPRVQRAPGLPCALSRRGGQEITHNSGAPRREIEDLCALRFQRWRRSELAAQILQEKTRPLRPGFFIVEVSDRERISAQPE